MFWLLKTRPRTKDVDAILESKETTYKLVSEVAEKHGLSREWLSDRDLDNSGTR